MTMTPDIDKLRELAVKAIDQTNAGKWREAMDEYHLCSRPEDIIPILDALEAANKRIAELENKIAIEEGVFS